METYLTSCEHINSPPHLNRDDKKWIRCQAHHYLFISDDLYYRGVNIVLCQFLTHAEAKKVLNACHDGSCGGHLSRMSTTQKIMCAKCFWPSPFSDCIEVVKHYPNCQLYAPKALAPLATLHPFIFVDPFCKWVIEFVEFLPPSTNNHKYIIMSIYYFTKWDKAMPTFNNIAATTTLFLFNLTMLSLDSGYQINLFPTMANTLKMRFGMSYLHFWVILLPPRQWPS